MAVDKAEQRLLNKLYKGKAVWYMGGLKGTIKSVARSGGPLVFTIDCGNGVVYRSVRLGEFELIE